MRPQEPSNELTSAEREIVRERLAEAVAQVLAPVFEAKRDAKEREALRN